jgi:hypothetical protein
MSWSRHVRAADLLSALGRCIRQVMYIYTAFSNVIHGVRSSIDSISVSNVQVDVGRFLKSYYSLDGISSRRTQEWN